MGVINVVNSCMFQPRYVLDGEQSYEILSVESVRRLFWPRASIVPALDVFGASRSLFLILAWIIISFRCS